MFRSSHFLFLVTFGNEVTKILCNLCLHFERQDGQDGKITEKNHRTKATKIPKTKRRKYGMNKTYTDWLLFALNLFFCSYYICDFMSETSLNFFLYEFCEISSYQTSFLFPLFSLLRKMTLRTKAIKKSFLGVAYLLFPFFPNFLKTSFCLLPTCLHILFCVW